MRVFGQSTGPRNRWKSRTCLFSGSDTETGRVQWPHPLGSITGHAHKGGVIMRTQRLIAYAFVVGLTCLSAGSVLAQNQNGSSLTPLKGHYQFSLNGTCILAATPPTFTAFPDLQPSPGAYSEVDQFYETGTINFDGLGHAISTHKGLSIATVAPAFNAPPYVVTYDQICRFTYVM